MQFNVIGIPALKDNYVWLIHDTVNKKGIVIDPGEASPVLKTIKELGIRLVGILITHHHWDHTNGIKLLVKNFSVPVCVPATEKILGGTQLMNDGDEINIPEWELPLKSLATPGHTAGHISFYGNNWLFSGDTLFTGGCGRVFDGTLEQLLHSLQKLCTLPDNTAIYCGHEYTLSNLRFAQLLEPHNLFLKQRIEKTIRLRQQNQCLVPSTLAEEKLTNPFLRYESPEIIQCIERRTNKKFTSAIEIFSFLRQWKNSLNI